MEEKIKKEQADEDDEKKEEISFPYFYLSQLFLLNVSINLRLKTRDFQSLYQIASQVANESHVPPLLPRQRPSHPPPWALDGQEPFPRGLTWMDYLIHHGNGNAIS